MRNPITMALLFALSGAICYGIIAARSEATYVGGVTFGLLAAWQFARSAKLGVITVIVTDLVWIASERIAIFLIADQHWNSYLSMAIAGLAGGFGVAIAAGLRRSLAWAGVAGAIAALPFGWWEQRNTDDHIAGVACFVIWQAVVGTTLWACSSPVRALPDTAPDH